MANAVGENHAKRNSPQAGWCCAWGVNQMRTPNIAMIAAACGFDAIYLDLEHNPTSLEAAAAICIAPLGIGLTPIARVSSRDAHDATEMGSRGQYNHVRMRQAYETTARAARAHGKWVGVGGVREDLGLQTWLLRLGMRYLTGGSDLGYILSAGRADVKRLREVRLP